jgi:hypothetical protein
MAHQEALNNSESIDFDIIKLPYCSDEDFYNQLDQNEIMCDLVQNSLDIANKYYSGRKRDSGRPFLNEHIYPMALRGIRYFSERGLDENDRKSELAQITSALILHDVLEPVPEDKSDDNAVDEAVTRTYDAEAEILNAVGGQEVHRIIYHQSEIYAPGNTNVKGIYLSKLQNANEVSQVISVIESIYNLLCSVANARIMPEKLKRCAATSREEILPIAEELQDSELYEEMLAALDLSDKAIAQLEVKQLEVRTS